MSVDLSKITTEEGLEVAPGVRVRLRSLADYRQNPENPVAHTPRNAQAVLESIHKIGAARSGFASDDVIYGGNLTWEMMAEAGIEGVVEVTTDGNRWVMVNRPDLSPEQRKQAAYGDQQGSFLAGWEFEQIQADIESGVDLSGLFTDIELESLLTEIPILDDGEFADEHHRGIGSGSDKIVVGFGRFAAPLDAEYTGGIVDIIKERWGTEAEVALMELCRHIESTLSGS